MPDPLSIAAAAIAVASASVQVVGKVLNKPGNNGYGKALADLEIKLTNARREEMDALEELFRGRMHELGNRVSDMGLRHELKINELDTEIKLLKQLLTK